MTTRDEFIEARLREVRAWMATRCRAESNVPVPRLARRPGHEHYHCGRELDQPPPRRWPADTGAIAGWTDDPE